jgi:glycosyltransferase involved in cell wall biosynthesis
VNHKAKVAVLIPCLNEAATVESVVLSFKSALPEATVFVFDNGSEDKTAELARRSGAVVEVVRERGKGNVVTAMFRSIDADFYVMADGDGTYPASQVEALLQPVRDGQCDMTVARRVAAKTEGAFPKFHRFGNDMVVGIVNFFFKSDLQDIFSGYRAFNRDAVKSIPLLSKGFEVETEMTLQALDKGFRIREVEVPYSTRPAGSKSKLNTYADGFLVLKTIFSIIKDYRPLYVFSLFALLSFLSSLGLGIFVISEFLQTGRVNHPSTAVLAAALMIFSLLSLATGMILDTIKRHFAELYFLNRIKNTQA